MASPARPWRKLYGTKRWYRLRHAQLQKDPLCSFCKRQGRVEAATVVDHIKAHKGDEALFHDAGNLQSLCATHHDSSKQKAEARGLIEIGGDVNGVPISPDHHWNQ